MFFQVFPKQIHHNHSSSFQAVLFTASFKCDRLNYYNSLLFLQVSYYSQKVIGRSFIFRSVLHHYQLEENHLLRIQSFPRSLPCLAQSQAGWKKYNCLVSSGCRSLEFFFTIVSYNSPTSSPTIDKLSNLFHPILTGCSSGTDFNIGRRGFRQMSFEIYLSKLSFYPFQESSEILFFNHIRIIEFSLNV